MKDIEKKYLELNNKLKDLSNEVLLDEFSRAVDELKIAAGKVDNAHAFETICNWDKSSFVKSLKYLDLIYSIEAPQCYWLANTYPDAARIFALRVLNQYHISYPECKKYDTYSELSKKYKTKKMLVNSLMISAKEKERLLAIIEYLYKYDKKLLKYTDYKYYDVFRLFEMLGIKCEVDDGVISFYDLDNNDEMYVRKPEKDKSPDILQPSNYIELVGSKKFMRFATTISVNKPYDNDRVPMISWIYIGKGEQLDYTFKFSKYPEASITVELFDKETQEPMHFKISASNEGIDDVYTYNLDKQRLLELLNDDTINILINHYYVYFTPELIDTLSKIKNNNQLSLK